jgi:DNA-binding response OmpR family regulator
MKALNVLVVDDASFIRDLIKKAMAECYPSFKILEAMDGRKAQNMLKTHTIDLVLCDWEMPEMSGLELITWMRSEKRYAKTPFMMITSRGERDHVIKAVTAGVSGYIGKPFTQDNFLAKIQKLLTKHFGISAKDSSQVSLGITAIAESKAKTEPAASPELISDPLIAQAQQVTNPQATKQQTNKAGAKVKGMAELRFGSGGTVRCVIKDINLQEMSAVFKREGPIPQLLEQAVLDIIDQEAGQVARINCYIRMLQAVENHADANTIKIIIRYVDDDPEKLATLSRFIAKVR